jgi:hypothetical protein
LTCHASDVIRRVLHIGRLLDETLDTTLLRKIKEVMIEPKTEFGAGKVSAVPARRQYFSETDRRHCASP